MFFSSLVRFPVNLVPYNNGNSFMKHSSVCILSIFPKKLGETVHKIVNHLNRPFIICPLEVLSTQFVKTTNHHNEQRFFFFLRSTNGVNLRRTQGNDLFELKAFRLFSCVRFTLLIASGLPMSLASRFQCARPQFILPVCFLSSTCPKFTYSVLICAIMCFHWTHSS